MEYFNEGASIRVFKIGKYKFEANITDFERIIAYAKKNSISFQEEGVDF